MCVYPSSITICCISAYTIIIWLLQCTCVGEETYETGYIETCIHSVHCRVFMPDLPKLILRKLLPKIFSMSPTKEKQKIMDVPFAMM